VSTETNHCTGGVLPQRIRIDRSFDRFPPRGKTRHEQRSRTSNNGREETNRRGYTTGIGAGSVRDREKVLWLSNSRPSERCLCVVRNTGNTVGRQITDFYDHTLYTGVQYLFCRSARKQTYQQNNIALLASLPLMLHYQCPKKSMIRMFFCIQNVGFHLRCYP